MYRTNASPQVETLHTKIIRPSKRADVVALFFGVALAFALVLLALLTVGAPVGNRWLNGAVALATLGSACVGLALARGRRRALRIQRAGERLRLVVERDGIELEFPIRCRATQLRTEPATIQQAYVQLIGANGRAILLRETRGSVLTRAGWTDDLDRTVESPSYDVSGPTDLAEVLDWVQRAGASRA